MKRAAVLIAILVAGCATPMTPEQRAMQMRAQHGPMCEAAGYKPDTAAFSQCVIALWQEDQNNRRQVLMMMANQPRPAPLTVYQMPPPPPTITCNTVLGTTTCR